MPGENSSLSSSHEARYKNKGLTHDELRRRREEDSIQLRKQKRDEQYTKRRNVQLEAGELSDYDGKDDKQNLSQEFQKQAINGGENDSAFNNTGENLDQQQKFRQKQKW